MASTAKGAPKAMNKMVFNIVVGNLQVWAADEILM
jgi:hypothetical protein